MKDEYIRKQDAIDAKHCDIKITGRENAETVCKTIESFTDGIKSLEPADVAPVVRCKNCKHHAYDEIFSCYWCEYPGRVRDTTPDGFCEKGEE